MSLLQVFYAQGQDEPDIEEVPPPDLQRHHLLPLLHVTLRPAGGSVLRGTQLPLRQARLAVI